MPVFFMCKHFIILEYILFTVIPAQAGIHCHAVTTCKNFNTLVQSYYEKYWLCLYHGK